MSATPQALEIVQSVYAAFGRGEVPAILDLIAEVEEILIFEPREFIPAGDSVTVLGWERTRTRPAGKVFETEWVHVFTARDGQITRYWGIYDTEVSAAARA